MSGCTNRVICTQMWGLSACGTNPAQQAGLESEPPRNLSEGTCVGLPVCAILARRRSAAKQMLSGKLAQLGRWEDCCFQVRPPIAFPHPSIMWLSPCFHSVNSLRPTVLLRAVSSPSARISFSCASSLIMLRT